MTSTSGNRGEVVGGRFEILGQLASGGESIVYRARDLELGFEIVLKERRITDSDDLSRLRREAALLMRTTAHPGLPVVRSDLVEGDRYFVVSDFVAGHDLRALAAAQRSGALALPTVLGLVDQVAKTLDHLHHHRPAVIHGDVKPENLIVDENGGVVLVDFGAAMRVGDDGERLGTPGFSAPEVLAGEPLGPAADVYSLAALTVFLLTGIVPKLGAPWPDALAKGHLERIEGVLRRGLTWDPLGRPWSASAYAERLREAAEMDIPTGTVTLVVLDSPVAAKALETAGGRIVTTVSLSDASSLIVFSRAGDAVAAALELITESTSIGLHAGDLGGWHGATLQQLAAEVEALRTPAARGLVCSPPVRMLLGGDPGLTFRPSNGGFVIDRAAPQRAEASPTHTLDIAVARARQWITSRRASPLAGREQALRASIESIERARSLGQSPTLVMLGEAGMGKTSLIAEVAHRALSGSEAVLVGRCTASGRSFEPFLDAFGDEVFPFESGRVEFDDEGWMDRRRFFGRIAETIRALGRPITLVVDDIQWIDGSSLALLSHLHEDLGPTLAVVIGCRPEVDNVVLDQLLKRAGATVISVEPLEVEAVASMTRGSGLSLDAATIADIHVLAAGNPFFCSQLVEYLRAVPGQTLAGGNAPGGVREWIGRRIDRLGAEIRATLAAAAVIGRSFEVLTLASMLGVSPLETLNQLDAASEAGLLVEGDHPGEFQFVHALINTTLEASLSAARRALLHATVAQVLEARGNDLENLEDALYHWFAADRLGNPLHAAELAVEVARLTTERLAHERALNVIDHALAILPAAAAGIERDCVEARLRLAHGRADLFASHNDEAMKQLYRAADLAEGAGEPATLAEAALVASLTRRHGLEDPDLARLLERASAVCPPEPAVLPAMLHIRRSRMLPLATPHEERSAIARLGLLHLDRMDPLDRATVEGEVARACWGPDDAADREALNTRLVDDARMALAAGGTARWTGVLIEALNHRAAARVQLGRLSEALADANEAAYEAESAGSMFLLTRVMLGQATINAALGDYDQSERLASIAVAISPRHNLLLAQLSIAYGIGRDRGEQAQLASIEGQFADLIDTNSLYAAGFALVHAEAGQLDDARRLLGSLDSITPWPRNWLWLATTVAALEAAVLVQRDDLTTRLVELLEPCSGQWALAGAELAIWGPVDRVLGLGYAALGRTDDALRVLTSALHVATREGAVPWIDRCRTALNEVRSG